MGKRRSLSGSCSEFRLEARGTAKTASNAARRVLLVCLLVSSPTW
jgi:hypothetical protein